MYNQTDMFVEEMVKADKGGRPAAVKTTILFVAFVIDLAIFLFFPIALPITTAVLAVGVFLGFKYTVTEYEYSYIKSGADADLDIDRITGQRKRTRLASIKCKQIREFVAEDDIATGSGKIVDASIGRSSGSRWVIIATNSNGADVTVIFNPSERLQAAIRQSMSRTGHKG